MSGWVKLYKSIVDHEIFTDGVGFRLFTFLMAKAAYEDGLKINNYVLAKGQYIRSYSKLCDDLAYKKGRGLTRYSKQAIQTAAKRLEDKGMIATEETEHGMLFTILNYSKFQGKETSPSPNKIDAKSKQSPELKPNVPKVGEDENLTPFQQIEEKYLTRKGALQSSPIDALAINRIINAKIPLKNVLPWIDEIFDQYVPKHHADGINSFSYCEKGILDRWAAKQNPVPNSNVSEFRPRRSVQENSFAALEEYAKEKGITMG